MTNKIITSDNISVDTPPAKAACRYSAFYMKKITLLTLGLLLTIFSVNGQDNKFSIGVSGSPDFYNYDFKTISVIGFDCKYNTKTNYSIGLRLKYNFAERFALKSGLLYSTKGFVVNYTWIFNDPNDPMIPKKSISKAGYLDVPLLINYNIINRKNISLFFSPGFVIGLLINDKEVSIMENDSRKKTDLLKSDLNSKLNTFIYAIDIDFGLSYNLNTKLVLTLDPYFKYGLNKIDNGVLKSNPTSYGAELGCYYNFK